MNNRLAALALCVAVGGGVAGCRQDANSQSLSGPPQALLAGNGDFGAPALPAPTAAPLQSTPASTASPTDVAFAGSGPDNIAVSSTDVQDVLYRAYGLNVMIKLAQLKLAERKAAIANVTVTDADIAAERQRTLDQLFQQANQKQLDQIDEAMSKSDQATADKIRDDMHKQEDADLDQVLTNQHLTRPEFELVIHLNAVLRKLAEPGLDAQISDDNVKVAFRAQYGEKVQVRHIECLDRQSLVQVQVRLHAGEPFAQVASELSANPQTKPAGGLLPPFAMSDAAYPQTFKEVAFGLKVGEVSDAIQTGDAWQIIQLQRRIEPKAVKYDDVKDQVRQTLHDQLLEQRVRDMRGALGQEIVATLKVTDLVLKQQYDDYLAKQQAAAASRTSARQAIDQQNAAMAEQQLGHATTEPTTVPSFMKPAP